MAKKSSRRSTRRSKKQQAQAQNQRNLGLIFGGLAVAVVIGLIVAAGGLGEGPSPAVAQERLDYDPILGEADAPVTIIEYGAYSCSACRAFHQSRTIERLLNDYAGQVNFTFRDFPVITPDYDVRTARIAQCVLDQDEDIYWAFHDVMYTQVRIGEGTDTLITFAGAVGADEDALRTCIEERRHSRTVEYDEDRAFQLGLRSTPSFTVNGQRIFSPTEQSLREAINAALGA